jgi:cell division septation protein DedD
MVAALLLALALSGALGNAWFYAACNRRIDAALAATLSTEDACALLALRASGRKQQALLAAGNLALLAVVTGLALVWPRGGSLPFESGKLATINATGPATVELGASGLAAQSVATAALAAASTQVSRTASAPALDAASDPTLTSVAASAWASAPTMRVSQGQVQAAATTNPAVAQPQLATSATALVASAPVANPRAVAAKRPMRAEQAAPASEGSFVVNVGLFADADNARNASAKLRVAGLPVLRQMVKTSKGASRTRVRAGPFSSRAEAETAAEKIRDLQLDAAVVKN